jgi:hypothetical protein
MLIASLVALLPALARAEEPLDLRYEPGRPLDGGLCKTIYAIKGRDDLVLAVAKPLFGGTLTREIAALKTLQENGIPAARVHDVGRTRDGCQAMVMTRYATGSKNPAAWRYLNQKSLVDLALISDRLRERHLQVEDLQYLVAHDGSLVVADPLRVKKKWLRPAPQIGSFAHPAEHGFLRGDEVVQRLCATSRAPTRAAGSPSR